MSSLSSVGVDPPSELSLYKIPYGVSQSYASIEKASDSFVKSLSIFNLKWINEILRCENTNSRMVKVIPFNLHQLTSHSRTYICAETQVVIQEICVINKSNMLVPMFNHCINVLLSHAEVVI